MPQALRSLAKGGTLVCGGIHVSDIPSFPNELLWQERGICSVANPTRRDGVAFLEKASAVPIRIETKTFPLSEANEALTCLRNGELSGAAILTVWLAVWE